MAKEQAPARKVRQKDQEAAVIATVGSPAAAAEQNLYTMPPVILDNDSAKARAEVAAYLTSAQLRANGAAARQEAARLNPYFEAWSARLKDSLQHRPVLQLSLYRKRPDAPELLTPGNLSRLFTAIADYNRSTIVSTVMLVPSGSYSRHGLLQDVITRGARIYNVDTDYKDFKTELGFIQIFKSDGNGRRNSSLTIPVMALDKNMLATIAPHGGHELLRHLQTAITWANHDLLHHFTADIVNSDVADNRNKGQLPLRDWQADNIKGYGDDVPDGYEGWANISHSRTWPYLARTSAGDEFSASVEGYAGKLAEIAEALARNGTRTAAERHEIIDYFSTMMLFTMARVMPLNDPQITNFIDKIRQIDPAPEMLTSGQQTIADTMDSFLRDESVPPSELSRFLRKALHNGDEKDKEYVSLFIHDSWHQLRSMITSLPIRARNSMIKEFGIKNDFDGAAADFLGSLQPDIFPELIEKTMKAAAKLAEKRPEFDIYIMSLRRAIASDMYDMYKHARRDETIDSQGILQTIEDLIKDKVAHYSCRPALYQMARFDKFDYEARHAFYGFDKAQSDYRTIKLAQVARMIPAIAYINTPEGEGPRLTKTRENADRVDVEMLIAVDKIVNNLG